MLEDEDALETQFKIANSILEQRHMAILGMKGFADPQPALPLFQQIARNAPFWKHAAEVQYRIGWITSQENIEEYEKLKLELEK